jgi:hypothetical protein
MTVRSLTQRTTLPLGIGALGILVIATGWLIIAVICASAAAAIVLATSHLRDR